MGANGGWHTSSGISPGAAPVCPQHEGSAAAPPPPLAPSGAWGVRPAVPRTGMRVPLERMNLTHSPLIHACTKS